MWTVSALRQRYSHGSWALGSRLEPAAHLWARLRAARPLARHDGGGQRELRYGPSNLTLALPGTSPYEEGGRPMRLLGLPASLLAQDATVGLAVAGYVLERRRDRLARA